MLFFWVSATGAGEGYSKEVFYLCYPFQVCHLQVQSIHIVLQTDLFE